MILPYIEEMALYNTLQISGDPTDPSTFQTQGMGLSGQRPDGHRHQDRNLPLPEQSQCQVSGPERHASAIRPDQLQGHGGHVHGEPQHADRSQRDPALRHGRHSPGRSHLSRNRHSDRRHHGRHIPYDPLRRDDGQYAERLDARHRRDLGRAALLRQGQLEKRRQGAIPSFTKTTAGGTPVDCNYYMPKGFTGTFDDQGNLSGAPGAGYSAYRTYLSFDFRPSTDDRGAYPVFHTNNRGVKGLRGDNRATYTMGKNGDGPKSNQPAYGPSSNHAAVVNHLMADGSVHCLSKQIDVSAYMFLITRNGGDPSPAIP